MNNLFAFRALIAPVIAISVMCACDKADSQEFFIDPDPLINDFVSFGEFSEGGNTDGWGNNGATTANVANGVLEVVSVSGDPWFFRSNIPGGVESFDTVEMRLRVVEGSVNGWEMFWGTAATPGYAGARRLGWSPGPDFDDMEFHVVHFDMSSVLEGSLLTHFRIDPTGGAGVKLELDYARLGTISPDSDGDGLPNTVETNTGIFVDARDTGTDPSKGDTDDDGFDDAIETSVGTDPNDGSDVPVPGIQTYTFTSAVYVVSVEIPANDPVISVGTVTSFAITPELPGGLNFDTASGRISGTATEAREATDYTITATFEGGATDEAVVNIEASNPFIEYTVKKRSLLLGQAIPDFTFVPNIFGPEPTSYAISPDLPVDLEFDANLGDIFGTPEEISLATDYTVTASYDGFPDASTTVTLSVLGRPIVTVDPEDSIEEIYSRGEFDSEDDLALWNANPRIAPLQVQDGSMVLETIGGDPFMSTNFSAESGCQIVEMRVQLVTSGGNWQVFWAEDAEGRSNFGAPGQPFTIGEIVDDGEFHVYRIDFTQATEGPLFAFRLDPAGGAGALLNIDYVRLLGCMAPPETPTVSIARADGNQITLTWTGTLEGVDDITGTWTVVDGTSPMTISTDGQQQFYRSVNQQ